MKLNKLLYVIFCLLYDLSLCAMQARRQDMITRVNEHLAQTMQESVFVDLVASNDPNTIIYTICCDDTERIKQLLPHYNFAQDYRYKYCQPLEIAITRWNKFLSLQIETQKNKIPQPLFHAFRTRMQSLAIIIKLITYYRDKALHHAIEKNNPLLVAQLLAIQANIGQTIEGMTAFDHMKNLFETTHAEKNKAQSQNAYVINKLLCEQRKHLLAFSLETANTQLLQQILPLCAIPRTQQIQELSAELQHAQAALNNTQTLYEEYKINRIITILSNHLACLSIAI